MASTDEQLVPIIHKEKLVIFCNYEFLYNKNDKMYKNMPKVSAAWREISKNLGISDIQAYRPTGWAKNGATDS